MTHFRHVTRGDVGKLVQRDGKDMIQVKKITRTDYYRMDENEWVLEQMERPLSHAHVAWVAFAADRVLCRLEGLHKDAMKEWASLSDEERRKLLESGPSGVSERRRRLWDMICATLHDDAA